MFPLTGVLPLFGQDPKSEEHQFLGTAFRFGNSRRFITATHCLQNHYSNILILNLAEENPLYFQVKSYDAHPTADCALIELKEQIPLKIQPFTEINADPSLGTPTGIYGFNHTPGGPMFLDSNFKPNIFPRALSGNIQATYPFKNESFAYRAGEISTPIPSGMSGSPVFLHEKPNCLIGVATANVTSIASQTLHEEVVTERENKITERERTVRLVEYGICVLLDPIRDWITKN